MYELPSFPLPFVVHGDGSTGRLIVTFRKNELKKGLQSLKRIAGISKLASAADFAMSALKFDEVADAIGSYFPKLCIAVCDCEQDARQKLFAKMGGDSVILDVEPERHYLAMGSDPQALAYLAGYRDAISRLMSDVSIGLAGGDTSSTGTQLFADDEDSTWGLKAIGVAGNRTFAGRGIKIALLDTGIDETHPDFAGRSVSRESFVPGEPTQDQIGHGTHCAGVACGFKDKDGRQYGIASEAEMFVGKVLGGPFGSGTTPQIVAGIEWAVANGCRIISLSLGADVRGSSTALDSAGRRALDAGTLVIAAAGNNARRPLENGFVGQPANSKSILAVGALNAALEVASFSSRALDLDAGSVDIAAPGVGIYSAWSMSGNPARYRSLNGTSMATPAVSGIAALFAEATGAKGADLWQLLVSHRRTLLAPSADVGVGLVQAPT